jgi:hypothetical protein
LKNEVKKKMMIDRRKLPHQSHAERNSQAKVNKNFAERVASRAFFIPRVRYGLGLTPQAFARIALPLPDACSARVASTCDAFLRSCIYNEVAKSSRELDSWPLFTM